ncbi:MAG: hypothetical protein P4L42_04550 [Desulfocapsaceae bacterium]|nr:hypothetical protein [Desulfocapsaceae bacterium]
MFHSAFQINQDFLASICARIGEIRAQYTQNSAFTNLFINTCLISDQQFTQIIDAAYWASQAMEEGRQIRLSLVFKEREHASNTFCFDTAIPLHSETLVKLGSALESSYSDICIHTDPDGKLNIWGLRMRSANHLTTDLWIQVLGPGNILIICYGRNIAALINNQGVFVDPTRFFEAITPKIFSSGTDVINDRFKFHRFYTLLYIAQAMRAHERGGTLLVVPAGEEWKNTIVHPITYTGGSSFLEPEFTSQPPPALHTAQDLFLLFQGETTVPEEEILKIRTQIFDQCSRIGRLTAIDGALVMTYDRKVHCFGATIKSAADTSTGSRPVRIIRPAEGDCGRDGIFAELGGTRHFSAAQFAYDHPNSIAIVASQAGNVSFFSRDKATGELLAIQKAELALMYEGISGIIWNLFKFMNKS